MNTYSRCLLYCLVAFAASMVLLSTANAACVAHWSFNNTLGENDTCSGTWDLTSFGAPTTGMPGVFNEAYNFTASGTQYETVGDLDLTGSFTICGWMNMTILTGNHKTLMAKGNGADVNNSYALFYNVFDGMFRFMIRGNGVASPDTGVARRWYFLCGVYDSGTDLMTMLINGSNMSSTLLGVAVPQTDWNASIGKVGDDISSPNYMDGLIDDVWVLDTSATCGADNNATCVNGSEIYNLFHYGYPIVPVPPPPAFNCSLGVCGVVSDCANQSGLEGVTVLVTQHNATNDFTFTNTTNASGYFELPSVMQDLTAQIVYTLNPYASVENEFLLTSSVPSWNGSTCLALSGTPYRVDVLWGLMSNETSQLEYIQSHSDWKPNVSYKKDVLLTLVQADVFSGGEPVIGLDLDNSIVTTTCSYAITPSGYAFFGSGTGSYSLNANFTGAFTQNLYAFCQDGDYFDIQFLGPGLNAKGRIDFQAYKMRASNVQLMVDNATLINATYANYTWAYALADFYQDTGDNRNIAMTGLNCSARLVYGPTATAWETAVILNNHAWVNFTTITTAPISMLIQWNCTSPGFDYFDQLFQVSIGEDAFTLAQCMVADPNGYQLDWNKVGQQINHWCAFRTYWNASLLNMRVKSFNANTNTERIFAYTRDQNNQWYFSTGLFYDDMPKGLNQWEVTLTGYPEDLFPGVIKYYQFVKVYSTPPAKISPDYCDGENCPKTLYKGEKYFCKVQTTFESEYTNIVSGIKLNGTNTLYSIKASDSVIDTVNHVHETSFEIPAMGEGDQYGISSDTTVQCYFELYIDADKLIYGETPTQMVTKYKAFYPSDILGFQKAWNSFANQKDKTSWLFNQITGIPTWFMASIHITDSNGNVNPILLVIYLIAFALIIALAIIWTTRRK